jgi:hypothetical protein
MWSWIADRITPVSSISGELIWISIIFSPKHWECHPYRRATASEAFDLDQILTVQALRLRPGRSNTQSILEGSLANAARIGISGSQGFHQQ